MAAIPVAAAIPISPDVERINVGGDEATQCLQLIKRLQLDPNYVSNWEVQEIYKINKNKNLRQAYEQRKAQLGPGAREIFAFACAGKDKVVSIARDGVIIKPSRHAIGDTNGGINLCRWSDVQLKAAARCNYMRVNLLVFKIAYCKQKKVEAREDNAIPPDPNFDCHVSKELPTLREPISDQLRKSQIYIYELNERSIPARRPRQVFPLVVIHYLRNSQPVISNPPPDDMLSYNNRNGACILPKPPAAEAQPGTSTLRTLNGGGAGAQHVVSTNMTVSSRGACAQHVPGTNMTLNSPGAGAQAGASTNLTLNSGGAGAQAGANARLTLNGRGALPILYHTLSQPIGGIPSASRTASPTVSGARQSPQFRSILPLSTGMPGSTNFIIVTTATTVNGQLPRPLLNSQSAMGNVRVSSSQNTARPLPTSFQIVSSTAGPGGHFIRLAVPSGNMRFSAVPAVSAALQGVLNGASSNCMPSPQHVNEAVRVKAEQNEGGRTRPVNDNIDLTADEIDESNVIEIAPIEESEDEPGGSESSAPDVNSLAQPGNTESARTPAPNDCDNLDAILSACDDIAGPQNCATNFSNSERTPMEGSNLQLATSLSDDILSELSSSQAANSTVVTESVPVTPTVSCSSETVETVATGTCVSTTSTGPLDTSDCSILIDLTSELDDVVDQLSPPNRPSTPEVPSTTSGVQVKRLRESPASKTKTVALEIKGNDSVPETEAETSDYDYDDVILLDSDNEESENPDVLVGVDNATNEVLNEHQTADVAHKDSPVEKRTEQNLEKDTEQNLNNLDTHPSPVQDMDENSRESFLPDLVGSHVVSSPATAEPENNQNVDDVEVDGQQEADQQGMSEVEHNTAETETIPDGQIPNDQEQTAHVDTEETMSVHDVEETLSAQSDGGMVNNQEESEEPVSGSVKQPAGLCQSPIHEPTDSEPSQDADEQADDYDDTRVFRVKASERRPNETIFEGTVFKIGDDGSVELVIERYFIRNRAKFVLEESEDDEDEETNAAQQNEDVLEPPVQTELEVGRAVSNQMDVQEESPNQEPLIREQEDTSDANQTVPQPDDTHRPVSPAKSSGGETKKKKASKRPSVRSGVKRKKKPPKVVPAKVKAVEGPVEPMPEPEKKRNHGRRMPVDIVKLRQEAIAKATVEEPCPQPEHEEVGNIESPPDDDDVEEPAADAGVTNEDSQDSGGLKLCIVDVRTEMEVPVEVEIDTADDFAYSEDTEIVYLSGVSPNAVTVHPGPASYEMAYSVNFNQLPICEVKTEDQRPLKTASQASEMLRPVVVLKRLTLEQIELEKEKLRRSSSVQKDLPSKPRSSSVKKELSPKPRNLSVKKELSPKPRNLSVKKELFSKAKESSERRRLKPKCGTVVKKDPEVLSSASESRTSHLGQLSSDEEMDRRVVSHVDETSERASEEEGKPINSVRSKSKLSLKGKRIKTGYDTSVTTSAGTSVQGRHDILASDAETSERKEREKAASMTSHSENLSSHGESDGSSEVKFSVSKKSKEESSLQSSNAGAITLLKESASSEDEFAEMTPKRKEKSRKRKKSPVLGSSSVDSDGSDVVPRISKVKQPKKKQKKSKQIIESGDSSDSDEKSKDPEMLTPKKGKSLTSTGKKSSPRNDSSELGQSPLVQPPKKICRRDGEKQRKPVVQSDESDDENDQVEIPRRKIIKEAGKSKSRVLSTDSERLSESSLDNAHKKSKKAKLQKKRKEHEKHNQEKTITPKKKLVLRPGAVLPKPGKDRSRPSIEKASRSTPDFSDSESEIESSVAVISSPPKKKKVPTATLR